MYKYIKALIIFNTRLFSSYHVLLLLLLLLLLYNPINMSKKAHSNHLDLNTSSLFTQSNYAGDPSSFGVGGGPGTVPGPGGGGLGGGGALINDSVYTPWTVTAFTPFFFINCTNAKFASPSTEYTNASIFVFNSSACSISLAYATYPTSTNP